MKTRTILASLAGFVAGLSLCFAADWNTGTWKLNEGKSKFAAGATKNHTVVYMPVGDMVKVTVDGVDKDGRPVHQEWTGKFDGKDYPVIGASDHDSRLYRSIDANTMDYANKKAGKLVGTGRIEISTDGMRRIVTTKGADKSQASMNNIAVYDRQ